MGNLKDFDLDLNKVKDKEGASANAIASLGAICTLISGIFVGSVVQGCSDKCVTEGCTVGCSTQCTTRDTYSCNGAIGGVVPQVRC